MTRGSALEVEIRVPCHSPFEGRGFSVSPSARDQAEQKPRP
jgi:hypothetical protein